MLDPILARRQPGADFGDPADCFGGNPARLGGRFRAREGAFRSLCENLRGLRQAPGDAVITLDSRRDLPFKRSDRR
jgi:hypothetical protein